MNGWITRRFGVRAPRLSDDGLSRLTAWLQFLAVSLTDLLKNEAPYEASPYYANYSWKSNPVDPRAGIPYSCERNNKGARHVPRIWIQCAYETI
jgi:hypothetical protein